MDLIFAGSPYEAEAIVVGIVARNPGTDFGRVRAELLCLAETVADDELKRRVERALG